MSAAALAWQQFRIERKLFWRNPSAAFFSFILPLTCCCCWSPRCSPTTPASSTSSIPGVAGMSVMATTFNAMAYNLTFLREQGILKRMRGTPMPTGCLLRRLPRQLGRQRVRPGRRW